MSDVSIQDMMGKRPTTKEEFVKAWNEQPKTTQNEAKALYDMAKKHFGVGKIDMPASSMGMKCMHGLLVTGWDWQRPTLKKNLVREAEPLVNAMFLEQAIAERYRIHLLRDAIVWGLRDTLQKSMTKHFPLTKLSVTTAGSLASPREWLWWDGIWVEAPPDDVYIPAAIDAEAQAQLVEDNRRIAAEKADYDAIMKVRKTIMSMPIARAAGEKKGKVNVEVAEAINVLTKVSPVRMSAQLLYKTVAQTYALSASLYDTY
jgi:hypothetical protein